MNAIRSLFTSSKKTNENLSSLVADDIKNDTTTKPTTYATKDGNQNQVDKNEQDFVVDSDDKLWKVLKKSSVTYDKNEALKRELADKKGDKFWKKRLFDFTSPTEITGEVNDTKQTKQNEATTPTGAEETKTFTKRKAMDILFNKLPPTEKILEVKETISKELQEEEALEKQRLERFKEVHAGHTPEEVRAKK